MLKSADDGCLTAWEKESRFEIIFKRAKGATAEDVDGKVFLDLTSCSGASPLGSSNLEFLNRLDRAMASEPDVLPSPVGLQRQKLSRRIKDAFPSHPRVFFLRTGSCATEAAVRIAREVSGKPIILTAGFHGWHDVFQQAPWANNAAHDPNILDFRYDLDLLEEQLMEHSGKVAGIFFTPEPSIFPPEVLLRASELAEAHGALTIVDEVLCGLRYAEGGYCRSHGIKADIITLAKGLAQGVPLSAVIGTDAAMAGADTAYLGNTYLRENRAFVAANITQDLFNEMAVQDKITAAGEALKTLFVDEFRKAGVQASVLGRSTMFDVILPSRAHGEAWANACLRNGIYVGYPATYMSNIAMDANFMAHLQVSLQRCLEDYLSAVDAAAPVTDETIIEYCKEAFRATENACLSCKPHWNS